MNIELPNLSSPTQATLEKYMPVLLAIAVAWLLGRGIRKMLWAVFGLYWAYHWIH